MSTEAKTEILARIRGALADQPTAPAVNRTYRTVSERPAGQVLEMLEDRLIDYKATVHHGTWRPYRHASPSCWAHPPGTWSPLVWTHLGCRPTPAPSR